MLHSAITKPLLALICAAALTQAIAGEQASVGQNIVGAIDPAAERRIGELLLERVLHNYSLSIDQTQTALVKQVGYRILHAIDDGAFVDDWQFIVIDSDQVNAMSLPGGKIIIFSGLLREVTTNEKIDVGMLAAVIGHEIVHARMHHFIANLRNKASMAWVLDNLGQLDANLALWSEEQKRRIAEMARARFTREQEFEADQLGSLYAALGGYGFDGAVRSLQVELKNHGDLSESEYIPEERPGGKVVAVDHPAWSERIEKIRSFQTRVLNVAGEFTWGNEMLRVGNLNKAIRCYKDAVDVFPNCFEAWNNLGKAYHLQYLQSRSVVDLKFQAQLIDYSRDLRKTVRGSSNLWSAIRAYRNAKQLDPMQRGVRLNLATALIHDAQTNRANREENLAEAKSLLNDLLAKDPENPQFLNAKAILLDENTATDKGRQQDAANVENLFRKSAARHYLPAEFNLAYVQFKSGNTDEGAAGLQRYLQYDSLSRWAAMARGLLHSKHIETPQVTAKSIPSVTSVLGVRLGARSSQVIETLGNPERTVRSVTADGSDGEIYLYYSLGIACVISDGQVESISLFTQGQLQLPVAIAEVPPAPELARVPIGATVDVLENSLGKDAQIRQAYDGTEKIYSYVMDSVQIDFFLQRSKVYLILLHKRA
jgi:predicted Zn-dependent protease